MNRQLERSTVRRPNATGEVRMGPVSLFVLATIVCMAVLAVLAVSTAAATATMSNRMALAVQEQYLDESAAQELLCAIDSSLDEAQGRNATADEAAAVVEKALPRVCEKAVQAVGGAVTADAHMEGRRILAEFTCENGRELAVEATIGEDLAYHIDRWKMTAVENEEQPTGTLWTGA